LSPGAAAVGIGSPVPTYPPEMVLLEALVLLVVPTALLVTLTVTESRRLRSAAQRFRELADEMADESVPLDALPEFATERTTMRAPDGEIVDAEEILRTSLRELRAWPPNRTHRAGRS
jgi:hypothetical protein